MKKNFLWDLGCFASVIGIWPRLIEPKLLATTHINIPIKNLPKDLEGLKIVHFSDLHLHKGVSDFFLKKLTRRIRKEDPDLIVFTGDFLCCSELDDPERLYNFFAGIKARYGSYAVLGNHDYAKFVSVGSSGDYSLIKKSSSGVLNGFRRLFSNIRPTGRISPEVRKVEGHSPLAALLEKTSFRLLKNEAAALRIHNSHLNVIGLEEYMLGKSDPELAFKNIGNETPGIALIHNPDAASLLEKYPCDLILCGHTHGGEVNLPWIWKKFTLIERPEWKRGLKRWKEKWIYINRGIGGSMPFRCFSFPELTSIRLMRAKLND